MMSRLIITLVCAVALGLTATSPWAAAPAAAPRESWTPVLEAAERESWRVEDLPGLQAFFRDKAVVDDVLRALRRRLDPVNTWSEEELHEIFPEPEPTVCEYRLVDLDRDGMLELVIADTGHGCFCSALYVLSRVGKSLTYDLPDYQTNGEHVLGIYDLQKAITDLDGDGTLEILFPRLLGSYLGMSKPMPMVEAVYRWDRGGFHRDDARFKSYYRKQLPVLQKELEIVKAKPTGAWDLYHPLWIRKYRMEIAEIQRLLATPDGGHP